MVGGGSIPVARSGGRTHTRPNVKKTVSEVSPTQSTSPVLSRARRVRKPPTGSAGGERSVPNVAHSANIQDVIPEDAKLPRNRDTQASTSERNVVESADRQGHPAGAASRQSLTSSRLMEQSEVGGVSTNTTMLRKRRLVLEAAEERARVKRRMLDERERIELELIDEKLAADMAAENDDRGSQMDSRTEQDRDERDCRTEQWVNDLRGNDQGPVSAQHQMEATDNVTQAILGTLRVVREASANAVHSRSLFNRSSLGKSLPTFSGNSVEWLRFKQSFESSVARGEYTEQENVSRLFQALSGDAREAVESLMVGSCEASAVMRTLELRFGSPDKILQKLVADIRQMPKVNTGKMDLITFATKVHNCVAAMQAMRQVGYLHNPDLVHDVITKLPSALVYAYNHNAEREDKDKPRLVRLADFLYREAELASAAGTAEIKNPSIARSKDVRRPDDKRMNARAGATYATTAAPMKEFAENPPSCSSAAVESTAVCVYCGLERHTLAECKQFLRVPVIRRWNFVKRNRLCFVCMMSGHPNSICKAETCKRRGCGKRHHYLLHEDRTTAYRTDNRSAGQRVTTTSNSEDSKNA